MNYEAISVKPLGGSLGAEIEGIDLRRLSAQEYREVKHALLDYQVIFFRDQDISPEQLVTLGKLFGELGLYSHLQNMPGMSVRGHPEIFLINARSSEEKFLRLSNVWHIDLSFTDSPPLGSILKGVEIPQRGGDTLWINLYQAYESLSKKMKDFLEGLQAVHDVTKTWTGETLQSEDGLQLYKNLVKNTPPVTHPVVNVHPETGRKCLYLSELATTRILELEPSESDAVLGMLFAHMRRIEFQCRFRWRKNSIAFWDNRCTAHYAMRDYNEPRQMHRVTIKGEKYN